MHKGRRIQVPTVIESSHGWVKFTVLNNTGLYGRPSKTLKKFIDLGFNREWWDAKLFEDLVVFGWDRGYLKSDVGILSLPFRYFLKDMDWSKKKRLKEVDDDGDAQICRKDRSLGLLLSNRKAFGQNERKLKTGARNKHDGKHRNVD